MLMILQITAEIPIRSTDPRILVRKIRSRRHSRVRHWRRHMSQLRRVRQLRIIDPRHRRRVPIKPIALEQHLVLMKLRVMRVRLRLRL